MDLSFNHWWLLGTLLGIVTLPIAVANAVEEVDYTPGNSFTFDVTLGNSNQDFGAVHIESDGTSGWILQVQSLNSATMKRSGSSDTIPYSLEINGNTINGLDSGNNETVLDVNSLTCAPPGGCDWDVRADIVANDLDGSASGSYSDTLIFTLTNY